VEFDEILEIDDAFVSPKLRLGVFNQQVKEQLKPKYRLYSVVEHIGIKATSGHYVSYTMDSDDNWKRFDDKNIRSVALDTVLEAKAYILFYELV
jgi:ubiquitin C-terminal hydrolase